MNINWTIVIIGFILAKILSLILGIFTGIGGSIGTIIFGGYTGLILATIIVGYYIDGDQMNGVAHGALIGLVGAIIGVIFGILSLTQLLFSGSVLFIITVVFNLIFGLIVSVILGGIGGAIGVYLRDPSQINFDIRDLNRDNVVKTGKMSLKLVETNLNEFIPKKSTNNEKGYLVCKKCGGYYQLQSNESPDDFSNTCECGGKIKYFKNINDFSTESEDLTRF